MLGLAGPAKLIWTNFAFSLHVFDYCTWGANNVTCASLLDKDLFIQYSSIETTFLMKKTQSLKNIILENNILDEYVTVLILRHFSGTRPAVQR